MVVRLLLEGKVRDKNVEDFIAEYRKRLQPHFDFELVQAAATSKQFEKIARSATTSDIFIAMDAGGKKYDSHSFADWFDKKRQGARSITFIIGEAEGLSQASRELAGECISLSDMTFSYRVSLMVLTEQIYRAMTIITGHPYHK